MFLIEKKKAAIGWILFFKVGKKQIPPSSNDHDYSKSNIDNSNVQRIIITITELSRFS